MNLLNFIIESNAIEGINRPVAEPEFVAYQAILSVKNMTVANLEEFVSVIQPGAVLRDKVGLDVQVGNHFPPRGGPMVRENLAGLLALSGHIWYQHLRYEDLHPFTDGNGRSGRVLWLWRHGGHAPLGFLHAFYYETLSNSDTRSM